MQVSFIYLIIYIISTFEKSRLIVKIIAVCFSTGWFFFWFFFLTALLGTKYITLITYKYNKHAVPKRENSERAIIAHARLPPDVTSVDIYKFT